MLIKKLVHNLKSCVISIESSNNPHKNLAFKKSWLKLPIPLKRSIDACIDSFLDCRISNFVPRFDLYSIISGGSCGGP